MINGQVGSPAPAARYRTLLSEAFSGLTTSTAIFANAPAGTKQIWLTVRTAAITLRTDAGTATAGANGGDFAANTTATPYVFDMSRKEALDCRAIQNGGASTGYIVYRG